MGRKVFISVLGTGFYEKCSYYAQQFNSGEVRFVQEASLKYIGAENWTKDDTAIFLLTTSARMTNWNRNIIERKRSQTANAPEPYESLETCIENLHLPFKLHDIDIPDGKNEEEMWEIFNIIFKLLKENDELYIDLTHSFRYLPMLLLVLSNYSKFLKNIKVRLLSYGNYEARNKETNEAPIVDLLPISALQDWTFAAANYLENGNVKRLVDLCNSELKPILIETKGKNESVKELQRFVDSLKKVIDERVNCRGINIVTSNNFKVLKQSSNKLSNTFIEPFNPVFERIKASLDAFDENENVQNGFAAVKWCLDFGLYQQAATILIENIVTYICCKNNLNWKVESERLLVNTAFKVKSDNLPESEWKVSNKKIEDNLVTELKEKVRTLLITSEIEILYKISVSLSDLRNDFNHAGMRNNPMSADTLKQNIIEKFIIVKNIIQPC